MHSNYNKVSETSMPVSEAEAWLDEFPEKRVENKPNHGIIASTPVVLFVGQSGQPLQGKAKSDAERRAKREYGEALRQLKSQERQFAKKLQEKKMEWSGMVVGTRNTKNRQREQVMFRTLADGGDLPYIYKSHETRSEYSAQRRNLRSIASYIDGEIVLLECLESGERVFTLNRFEQYNKEIVTIKEILPALLTGKMVSNENIKMTITEGRLLMADLAKHGGHKIEAVKDRVDTRSVKGWIIR